MTYQIDTPLLTRKYHSIRKPKELKRILFLPFISGLLIPFISFLFLSLSCLLSTNPTVYNSYQFSLLHNRMIELTISSKCCYDMNNELNISNYMNLQTLVVKQNSLQSLKSLKISNNPVLQSIVIENNCLNSIHSFVLTSILYLRMIEQIFLILLV